MKRFLFALCAALLLCGLCSCESDQDPTVGSGTTSRENISYDAYSGTTASGEMTFDDVFSIGGEWVKDESQNTIQE